MPVRIILLTQWFDPEPTFKGLVFARELVNRGFDVEVITGFPNYPGGKLYPGYRQKIIQREIIEGVHITRVPLYPSHDKSSARRALNYISFAVSSLIYGLFIARRANVIYAYHPPLTVGVVAALLRFFRRTPIVYDIQDMWPDTLQATGMLNNTRILKTIDRVCRWVYRRVDRIVVLSPGFKQLLTERGVPAQKIDVIYNWADEFSLLNPTGSLPENFPDEKRFRVLFAGNMGKAQALDTVLEAAGLLQAADANVVFTLVGNGIEVSALKQKTNDLKLNNVVFIPAVPMQNVGMLLNAADALLVHLRKDPLFKITIPSKTQAYMAMGKPILMGVDGDAADIIRVAGAGKVFPSEDAQRLAAEVLRLASMPRESLLEMGEKARHHYQTHLSLQKGLDAFSQIFQRFA